MAIVANGMSYNVDQVRQVLGAWEQLRASRPNFLSLVRTGASATNTKVEWSEDSIAPLQTTISAITGNDATLTSISGFVVGSILRFSTSADVSKTEYCRIASIAGSVATLTRTYGSTTSSTLAIGDKVYLVSSPKAEGSLSNTGNAYKPVIVGNQTEIFSNEAEVTKTAQIVSGQTVDNLMSYAEMTEFNKFNYNMNNASLYGRRVYRDGSNDGTMGGVMQFIEGGNINTTGGALSKTHINDMLEQIYTTGSFSNNLVILCAPNQGRKISAFNTAGTNPLTQIQRADTTTGSVVTNFQGDLATDRGAFQARLVVEPSFPKDKLCILDMDKIEIAFLRTPQWADATPQGADLIRTRLVAEATLRVLDGQKGHAMATGLTV